MAARTNRITHVQEVRNKIGTTQLILRLRRFALGDPAVDMNRAQVSAAIALLRKTLPDLSSTDLGTADGLPLQVSIVKFNDLADDDKPEER
jgi:hypothetical protein